VRTTGKTFNEINEINATGVGDSRPLPSCGRPVTGYFSTTHQNDELSLVTADGLATTSLGPVGLFVRGVDSEVEAVPVLGEAC
jgi:hypothetical protein